ncbi:MAG: hypothetical protein WA745_11545, partial [Methylovirgula sp.]
MSTLWKKAIAVAAVTATLGGTLAVTSVPAEAAHYGGGGWGHGGWGHGGWGRGGWGRGYGYGGWGWG